MLILTQDHQPGVNPAAVNPNMIECYMVDGSDIIAIAQGGNRYRLGAYWSAEQAQDVLAKLTQSVVSNRVKLIIMPPRSKKENTNVRPPA